MSSKKVVVFQVVIKKYWKQVKEEIVNEVDSSYQQAKKVEIFWGFTGRGRCKLMLTVGAAESVPAVI